MNTSKNISVIITNLNCKESLEKVVSAFDFQQYSKENFDVIIVVDNWKLQIEMRMLQTSRPWLQFRVVENTGQAAALKMGVLLAEGEIIAFLEGGCFPREDWLQKINQHFVDHQHIGVLGVSELLDDNIINDQGDWVLRSNNVAYKAKAIFEAVGIQNAFSTDSSIMDLYSKVSKIGRVGFNEEVRVWSKRKKALNDSESLANQALKATSPKNGFFGYVKSLFSAENAFRDENTFVI